MVATATASSSSINEQEEQQQQVAKRVPRNYWRLTVISKYVPEVLKKLARQGRIRPTIRRIFYTVASDHPEFPRTKSGYSRLSALLTDVRLRSDDYEDWDSTIYDYRPDTFSDDSRSEVLPPRYVRPKRFVQEHILGMMYVFDNYDPNIWEGQNHVVEIMIEKRTMESTVKDIVKSDQVTVFAAGGNDGLSHLKEQYERWKEYQRQGKDVHIGYLGDSDAWGEHMDQHDIIKKILQMIEDDIAHDGEPLNWDWGKKKDWDNDDQYNKEKGYYFESHYDPDKPEFTFERLALTEDQIEEYDLLKLDRVHIKQVDNPKIQQINFAARHGGYVFTVELDAIVILHEEEFKQLIHNFIYRWYDHDIWDKVEPLLAAEVKDEEVKKRITFKKLVKEERKQWLNDELEIDDETDLNEIVAESLGKDSVEELEAPDDLIPMSDKNWKNESNDTKMKGLAIHYGAKQRISSSSSSINGVEEVKEVPKETDTVIEFPYGGLPDEERAKKLKEDRDYFKDELSGRPSEKDRAYFEQRLRETDNELHKLAERGIGGYIAGSEHDPLREEYEEAKRLLATKEEEEQEQEGDDKSIDDEYE